MPEKHPTHLKEIAVAVLGGVGAVYGFVSAVNDALSWGLPGWAWASLGAGVLAVGICMYCGKLNARIKELEEALSYKRTVDAQFENVIQKLKDIDMSQVVENGAFYDSAETELRNKQAMAMRMLRELQAKGDLDRSVPLREPKGPLDLKPWFDLVMYVEKTWPSEVELIQGVGQLVRPPSTPGRPINSVVSPISIIGGDGVPKSFVSEEVSMVSHTRAQLTVLRDMSIDTLKAVQRNAVINSPTKVVKVKAGGPTQSCLRAPLLDPAVSVE